MTARIPASTAARSSSSRLPGPVITIRSGGDPRAERRGQLAAGRDVGAEAQPAEVRDDGQRRVGLDRVGELDRRRQDGRQRRDLAVDDVEVVDVERRAESLGELVRVADRRAAPRGGSRCGPAVGRDAVGRAIADAHRSASSSATRAAVPGVAVLDEERDRDRSPCSSANAPPSGRARGRRPRPAGTASGASGVPGEHALADEVVQPRRAGQRHARPDDRAAPDEHALEQGRAGADERVVLDDDRARARRLEHAADRHAGREVDARADLRARADEHVRVDHRRRRRPTPRR